MIRVRCPICDRRMEGARREDWPEFPFCSKRCKLVDLGRWLGGGYRLTDPDATEADFEQSAEQETP